MSSPTALQFLLLVFAGWVNRRQQMVIDLKGYVERFVLSIKSECLDKIVPLGEAHHRWAVRQYVLHYHSERTHQGLEGALIVGDGRAELAQGEVRCRELVGGLLRFYCLEAA